MKSTLRRGSRCLVTDIFANDRNKQSRMMLSDCLSTFPVPSCPLTLTAGNCLPGNSGGRVAMVTNLCQAMSHLLPERLPCETGPPNACHSLIRVPRHSRADPSRNCKQVAHFLSPHPAPLHTCWLPAHGFLT